MFAALVSGDGINAGVLAGHKVAAGDQVKWYVTLVGTGAVLFPANPELKVNIGGFCRAFGELELIRQPPLQCGGVLRGRRQVFLPQIPPLRVHLHPEVESSLAPAIMWSRPHEKK